MMEWNGMNGSNGMEWIESNVMIDYGMELLNGLNGMNEWNGME